MSLYGNGMLHKRIVVLAYRAKVFLNELLAAYRLAMQVRRTKVCEWTGNPGTGCHVLLQLVFPQWTALLPAHRAMHLHTHRTRSDMGVVIELIYPPDQTDTCSHARPWH